MSGAVSETAPPTSPNTATPLTSGTALFSAFAERKPSRLRWVLLALVLVAVPGLVALLRSRADLAQVMTRQGILTVHRGMSPTQVRAVLGTPVTRQLSDDGRTECYRHGVPTLAKPTFNIYSACYEEGELRSVTLKKYEAWDMDASLTASNDAP